MNMQELLTLKALEHKRSRMSKISDQELDGLVKEGKLERVQMCAKVHPELYTRLEEICGFFGFTKREFIEQAVADAVFMAENKLHEVCEDNGYYTDSKKAEGA